MPCSQSIEYHIDYHPYMDDGGDDWICTLTRGHPGVHMATYDPENLEACGCTDCQDELLSTDRWIIQWNLTREVIRVYGQASVQPPSGTTRINQHAFPKVNVDPRDRRLIKARRLP